VKVPFDSTAIRLNGAWSADDEGIYYIRQVGGDVWWSGMSDYAQANGEVGREFSNVAKGKLRDGMLAMEFADVPRGSVWGNGPITLKAQADADGNLQLVTQSGDFGGRVFTPCEPPALTNEGFAMPFSFRVPFGTATARWVPSPDLAVAISSDIRDAGISTWVIGPGWTSTCTMGAVTPLEPGAAAFIDYLHTVPGLEVSDIAESTIDGRTATSVEVRVGLQATLCDDQNLHLWKQTDNEASIGLIATTRIIAVDVGPYTIAFEIWGNQDTWGPTADAILDTVRFDETAAFRESIGEAADDGAHVVRVDALDPRTRDLTIESPTVGYAKVRLLLPDGFDPDASESWPVLYLLHGCCDDYTSWTRETDVEDIEELRDVLVVMPTGGQFGFYSDWWNQGAGGPPGWETFHLQELLQLLERNWQAGKERVVAGLSMGGFGAMEYTARNPGVFRAAASYSGVMDTLGSDFEADPAMWGDKVEQRDVWEAHNPVSLAAELEGVPLYVSYGEGSAGPLDSARVPFDDLEPWIAQQNVTFVERLEELGIPATVDAYGPGSHTWPYWERELHDSLPMLLGALGVTAD
jgi:S-formylglutathione hydrolase FrmB